MDPSTHRAVNRRTALRLIGLGGAATLAAACQAAAPTSPTAAPAKPTEAAKPAAPAGSPAASPAAKPAASPAASPAAAASTLPAAVDMTGIAAFDERAVGEFYRGKTVRLVVGYGAGGGYDTYARVISKYAPKHIPGNPTVIVENQPGAGSAVALSAVYRTLPKDGTVLGIGDGSLALQQIVGVPTGEFDASKWQYIGAPSIFEFMYIASKAQLAARGISKFEDHLGPSGKEMVVGQTGPGIGLTSARVVEMVAGAKMKHVFGYAGTAQIRTAMDGGEVDGFFTSWDSVKVTHPTQIANGEHVIFMIFPREQIKDLPYRVSSVWDFAKTEEDRQLIRYGAIDTHTIARPYVVAPEVPKDRVSALQTAFVKTMQDPEFLADAAQLKLDIQPLNGPRLGQIVTEFFAMPDSVKPRLKEAVSA